MKYGNLETKMKSVTVSLLFRPPFWKNPPPDFLGLSGQ